MTLVALLVLLATPPLELSAPPDEITITAERLLHDGAAQRSTAEGRATLTTSTAVINADRILFDRKENSATAAGNVVVRVVNAGLVVITGDVVMLRLDGDEVRELFMLDGVAVSKQQTTARALLAAPLDKVMKTGVTSVMLKGNHLLRRDDGTWHLDDIDFVPCECDFDHPSWGVHVRSVDIDFENDRASALLPMLKVYGVPLPVPFPFPVPWLSLPLSDRQTGLLFPKPNSTVLNGWTIEQPIFVTLGRSADLTFTPGYFFGAVNPPEAGIRRDPFGLPIPGAEPLHAKLLPEPIAGIRGPRLLTEFRYTPSRKVSGRVSFGAFYDFKKKRDPVSGFLTLADTQRGWRGEGSWTHTHDFGRGFGIRLEGFFHSDGSIQADLVPDVVARQAGYLRSTAIAFHRGADHLVSLDAVLRQDLSYGYNLFGLTPRALGTVAPMNGPNPIQRLPAVLFAMPTFRVWGPVAVDFQAELVRTAPVLFGTGDEGNLADEGRTYEAESIDCLRERLYFVTPWPSPCAPLSKRVGQGDRLFQLGEREARTRLTLSPRVSAAWRPGGVVALSAWAAWRQGLWLGELTGRTSQRGYPLLSARAETELAGVWTSLGLRHSITPVVELRALPRLWQAASMGPSSPAPYDEIDLAVPSTPGARAQLVTEVLQRLVSRAGREHVRLELGQGYNLLAPEPGAQGLGETYGRVVGGVGWFNASVLGRYDVRTFRPTRIAASAGIEAGPPFGAGLSYENVLDDGTNRTRAPIDLLFGNPVSPTALSRAQIFTCGARGKIGPIGFGTSLVFTDRDWTIAATPTAAASVEKKVSFAQWTTSGTFSPACDCWRLDFAITTRLLPSGFLGAPEPSLNFTATRFGSLGTTN